MKAGTRFSDPGGMQGRVDLVNLKKVMPHFVLFIRSSTVHRTGCYQCFS